MPCKNYINILFLGQNPSPTSPGNSFTNTKSMKTLNTWLSKADIQGNIRYSNVFSSSLITTFPIIEITKRVITPGFFKAIEGHDVIFTCGNIARQAMEMATIINPNLGLVVNLPHPSGLNRQLNNEVFVDSVIDKMRKAYESIADKKMEGIKKEPNPTHRGSLNDVLSGKSSTVCPVVKEAVRRLGSTNRSSN